MPASTRRAVGALLAALGVVFVVVGSWVVVKLGPSGEAQFSTTSKAPGAIVVPASVLNSVDVPVRITVSRADRRAVHIVAGPSSDARAVLAGSAVSTVSAAHYPAGTLDLRSSGAGALADIGVADVWRLAGEGTGTVGLVVDQASRSGVGPETAVVTSGDSTALTDVTVTLTWADRAWFFEALVMATIGAVLTAFALNDLWQGRVVAVRTDVATTKTAAEAK